jgi:hypothetical protein
MAVLDGVLGELLPGLLFRVCHAATDVSVSEDEVSFSFGKTVSRSLAERLRDCDSAVIFAATVGFAPDILVRRYRFDPLRGLLAHAAGTERVEALCDAFCAGIKNAVPRFSPGYGDLPLSFQRDIFDFLSPERHIGLSLGENLIMSPSKSVTAIVGTHKTAD